MGQLRHRDLDYMEFERYRLSADSSPPAAGELEPIIPPVSLQQA